MRFLEGASRMRVVGGFARALVAGKRRRYIEQKK